MHFPPCAIGILLKWIRGQRLRHRFINPVAERIPRLNQLVNFLRSFIDQRPTGIAEVAFYRVFVAVAVRPMNLYRIVRSLEGVSDSSSTWRDSPLVCSAFPDSSSIRPDSKAASQCHARQPYWRSFAGQVGVHRWVDQRFHAPWRKSRLPQDTLLSNRPRPMRPL